MDEVDQHRLIDQSPEELLTARQAASLLGVVVFGTLAGSMLPLALHKLGFDPASASALKSPTADGKFLFYGLCHELGHVIAMWGDRANEEDRHSWAHYTGVLLVEHLSARAGSSSFLEELRDARWHSREVYRALERRSVAFCIYEIAGQRSPREVTAGFTYVRLHGPTDKAYEGSYSKRQLDAWARQIEEWSRKLDAVYVYFDNDESGYAPRNALALKELVGRKKAA